MEATEQTDSDLFSTVSKRYDILNQILSFGIDMYWRRMLLSMMVPYIHKNNIVLDLATGTFDIAKAIVKRVDATVLAVDYSLTMLSAGASKIEEYPNIIPIQADGRCLPICNESVDIATISFGIRNILPRSLVFNEWFRLLKTGSRIYILEFCNPQEVIPSIRNIYIMYITKFIPFIASLFGGDKAMYEYLAESIHAFPLCKDLILELELAGFSDLHYTKFSFGTVAIYSGIKK